MSPKLPPSAQLARWAVRLGPLLLPHAKRLYEQGRFRQVALLHARTLEQGSFSWEMSKGERIWVVWSGDELVVGYPVVSDDELAAIATNALPERRQDPDELPSRRLRERFLRRAAPAARYDEQDAVELEPGAEGD